MSHYSRNRQFLLEFSKVYTNAEIDNATNFKIEVTDRVGWTVTESYGSTYTPATGWDD